RVRKMALEHYASVPSQLQTYASPSAGVPLTAESGLNSRREIEYTAANFLNGETVCSPISSFILLPLSFRKGWQLLRRVKSHCGKASLCVVVRQHETTGSSSYVP